MNKLLLALGSVASVVTPVMTVVACSVDEEKIVDVIVGIDDAHIALNVYDVEVDNASVTSPYVLETVETLYNAVHSGISNVSEITFRTGPTYSANKLIVWDRSFDFDDFKWIYFLAPANGEDEYSDINVAFADYKNYLDSDSDDEPITKDDTVDHAAVFRETVAQGIVDLIKSATYTRDDSGVREQMRAAILMSSYYSDYYNREGGAHEEAPQITTASEFKNYIGVDTSQFELIKDAANSNSFKFEYIQNIPYGDEDGRPSGLIAAYSDTLNDDEMYYFSLSTQMKYIDFAQEVKGNLFTNFDKKLEGLELSDHNDLADEDNSLIIDGTNLIAKQDKSDLDSVVTEGLKDVLGFDDNQIQGIFDAIPDNYYFKGVRWEPAEFNWSDQDEGLYLYIQQVEFWKNEEALSSSPKGTHKVNITTLGQANDGN